MISAVIEVNQFGKIHLILQAKFGQDPLRMTNFITTIYSSTQVFNTLDK